jgi:tRNA-Thr(GGU) m(6)t(6)A37 methyltransferase TsaA
MMDEVKRGFELVGIGRVEKRGERVGVKILDKYREGLKGLEAFSHAWVLYWFDKNDRQAERDKLLVHPRGDRSNPLTGVFACRAPVRPNLIGLSLCEVVSIEGGVVYVGDIDAFDGSAVLDVKPYIPATDRASGAVRVADYAAERG